jgi:hypothetical protein
VRDFLRRHAGPAAAVVALHLGVLLALLTLRPSPNTYRPETPLLSVRVPFEALRLSPMPALDASYWAPPFAKPSVIVPEMADIQIAPGENAISGGMEGLSGYLGCGILSDEAMSAPEREKCDALRKPLYAGPGQRAPPTEAEIALERHFDREKARQEAAVILPCMAFTDILCVIGTLVSGADFKMGSWADAKRKPENRLAEPAFPYRP